MLDINNLITFPSYAQIGANVQKIFNVHVHLQPAVFTTMYEIILPFMVWKSPECSLIVDIPVQSTPTDAFLHE